MHACTKTCCTASHHSRVIDINILPSFASRRLHSLLALHNSPISHVFPLALRPVFPNHRPHRPHRHRTSPAPQPPVFSPIVNRFRPHTPPKFLIKRSALHNSERLFLPQPTVPILTFAQNCYETLPLNPFSSPKKKKNLATPKFSTLLSLPFRNSYYLLPNRFPCFPLSTPDLDNPQSPCPDRQTPRALTSTLLLTASSLLAPHHLTHACSNKKKKNRIEKPLHTLSGTKAATTTTILHQTFNIQTLLFQLPYPSPSACPCAALPYSALPHTHAHTHPDVVNEIPITHHHTNWYYRPLAESGPIRNGDQRPRRLLTFFNIYSI